MRKIVISSGLGLVAAAMPAYGAALPVAVEPAGVREAGRVGFAAQGSDSQGVLIGLNKPGSADQIKQGATLSPYDKMNAEAQLKIKGEYKFNKAGETQIKTQDQIKAPGDSQLKIKSGAGMKYKAGDAIKYGSGGGEGIVRPNCYQAGQ